MKKPIIPAQAQLHTPNSFYRRMLNWYDRFGRKDLPWQQNPTPYRVWISEIMLQQTQVTTVIPYYQRFMERFPSIDHLATAQIDEVLHHWSGLGYYARARNLHKTAAIISVEHRGKWPNSIPELEKLPGIGRSTAGAIASLGMGERAAILDGNVKRVLARVHAVEGWPGQTATLQRLWEISEHYTPKKRCNNYNQAMMDLGATICKRSKPDCNNCPVKSLCQAYQANEQALYPSRKPKKEKPVKSCYLLMLTSPTHLLLEQRPPTGIWGGLWSFPEFDSLASLKQYCATTVGAKRFSVEPQPTERHTFSHFHLDYTPVTVSISRRPNMVSEASQHDWFKFKQPIKVGLSAPVYDQIQKLMHNSDTKPLQVKSRSPKKALTT